MFFKKFKKIIFIALILGILGVLPEYFEIGGMHFGRNVSYAFDPALDPCPVSIGADHILALTSDGRTWSWGKNYYGNLGLGDIGDISVIVPAEIKGLTGVRQIISYGYSSFAIMNDSTVKAWGSNTVGQLGFPDKVNRNVPEQIPNISNVKQVAASTNHTVALLNDGTVKTWGSNYYGQLGLGDTTNRTTPTIIPNLSNVRQVAAGEHATLFLMDDGTVKYCGYSTSGTSTIVPTEVKDDGEANLSGVKSIAVGSSMYALLYNGTLKAWGSNDWGQLGLGYKSSTRVDFPTLVPDLSGVKQICADSMSATVLLNDGTLKIAGRYFWGYQNQSYPYDKESFTVITNSLLGGGSGGNPLAGVRQIAAGYRFSIAVMEDGTLKAWGYNGIYDSVYNQAEGTLGTGDLTNSYSYPATVMDINVLTAKINILKEPSPISCKGDSVLILQPDGTVKSSGVNTYGQLGLGDNTNRTSFVTIPNLTGVKEVIQRGHSSYTLMNDGTVKAWGYNYYSQLGLGHTNNVNVPTTIPNLTKVKKIYCDGATCYALMMDGTVKAWGNNERGQVGTSYFTVYVASPFTISEYNLRKVKELFPIGESVFALTVDGKVKSWGKNDYGQLGFGSTQNTGTPTQVNLSNVKEIASDYETSYAIMNDGTVKAWGRDVYDPALGYFTQKTTPFVVTGVNNIKNLIAKSKVALVLTNDNRVKVWGNSDYDYMLGLGGGIRIQKTPIDISLLAGAKQIISNGSGFSALMQDGTVKSWGYNYGGSLGLGYSSNGVTITTPTQISNLTGVVYLASNSNGTVFAIMNGSTVKGWGGNGGKLGLGDTDFRPSPVDIPNIAGISLKQNRSNPTVNTVSPTADQVFTSTSSSINPTITVSDFDNDTVTCKLYIDAEASPRQTLTVSATALPTTVTFNSFDVTALSDNCHVFRFEVSDSVSTIQSSVYVKRDGSPVVNGPLISTTQSSICVRGSAYDLFGLDQLPYKIDVGEYAGEWTNKNTRLKRYLSPGTKYTVTFSAKDKSGNVTSVQKDVHTKPSSTEIEIGTITGTTTEIILADRNSSSSEYCIKSGNKYVNAKGNLIDGQVWIYLSDKKITVNGLTQGTEYKFEASVRNGEGIQASGTGEVTFRTLPNKPDTLSVKVSRQTDDSFTIMWSSVDYANKYDVEINGVIVDNGLATSYTVQDISPNTLYTIRVRAVSDLIGNGDFSESIGVRTPVTIPQNLRVSVLGSSAALTWDAVSGVQSYELEADGAIISVAGTTYTHTGLGTGTQHEYRVKAINSEYGNSSFSDYIRAITAPGDIADVWASTGSTDIKVLWNYAGVWDSFDIEVDGTITSGIEKMEYLHKGAGAGLHSYRIRAINTSGTGTWSQVKTFQAQATTEKTVILNDIETDDILNVSIRSSNIKDTDVYTFCVTYNPNEVEVIDLCALTVIKETSVCDIRKYQIKITEFTPGVIKFTVQKPSMTGKAWFGEMNKIKFKSKIEGNTTITYKVQ